MEHHYPQLEREISLSWKNTRAKVHIYLPWSEAHDLTVTLRQTKAKDHCPGGNDIVCLHRRDVETLAKFVEDCIAEAKDTHLAVC